MQYLLCFCVISKRGRTLPGVTSTHSFYAIEQRHSRLPHFFLILNHLSKIIACSVPAFVITFFLLRRSRLSFFWFNYFFHPWVRWASRKITIFIHIRQHVIKAFTFL